MSHINLTAGSLRLQNYLGSDTFQLTIQYNEVSAKAIDVRGVDGLYDLQYLVNRAVQKLELDGKHQERW